MRRVHWRTVAAAVAVSVVAAACGGNSGGGGGGGGKGDTTGITDSEIKLGAHFPLTGPAAPGYSEIGPAAKAYFDYVNAQGGVYGRKINYIYRDDAYNPTQTVQVTRQLVLQDKVAAMVGGLGTPTHTKVVDYLNQQKVPDLFVSSGCLCWDQPDKHPYTFGWQPDYTTEGKILGKYIKDNFAGKKVAIFGQDDDFGADGAKGADQFLPAADVVTRQKYQPGNTDIGPQIAAIAQSKADVVLAFTIPAYTALLKLGLLKANVSPQLVVTNVGSDPVTLAGLLEAFAKQGGATVKGTDLLEGMVSDTYLPGYLGPDVSNSWTQLFTKVRDQYAPKLPLDGNVLYGMAMAYTTVQVLQKAGKDLTREKIVSTVKAGGLTGGPGLVPFRYGAESNAGYGGVRVYQFTGGAPKFSGDPQVTDSGTGDVTPYTEAASQAPANGVPGTS